MGIECGRLQYGSMEWQVLPKIWFSQFHILCNRKNRRPMTDNVLQEWMPWRNELATIQSVLSVVTKYDFRRIQW